MNRLPTIAFVLSCLAFAARAQDPAVTDGDKYKVLLDNDRVRVLAYSDRPGEKTQQHQHPAFVVYALAPFKRRLTLSDGRQLEREFKAGDVLYSDGETHIGENIGSTATRVLMVEIKGARP
jgi:quercetin dioxygenase-like cupin family protein